MPKPYKRRRLFIDPPIQLALILRALSYWTICLIMQILAVTVLPLFFSAPENLLVVGERFLWTLGLGVLGSVFALPLILMDVLRLSHRWVGPVYRLRSYLRSVREGKEVGEVRFREGDFWPGLATDINCLIAELNRARAAEKANSPATQATDVEASEEMR
jgi:hypothetical protein